MVPRRPAPQGPQGFALAIIVKAAFLCGHPDPRPPRTQQVPMLLLTTDP